MLFRLLILCAFASVASGCSRSPAAKKNACTTDPACGVGHICSSGVCLPGCSATQPSCLAGTVCDPSSKTCVGCETSSDCTLPSLPACDTTTHTCVACETNANCPTGTVCNTATNTCIGCLSSSDCAAGAICINGSCGAGCSSSHPCSGSLVCDVDAGKCVQCETDASCSGATPRCDPQTDTCVPCISGPTDNCPAGETCQAGDTCRPGCSATHPCANPYVCDVSSGACVQCVTTADCAANTVCNTSNHQCVTCVADSDCPSGDVCAQNQCVAGCTASQPCPNGQECNTSSGHCVACLGNSDCSAPTPVCDTASNTCVACVADTDCPSGDYCGAGNVCTQGCRPDAGCPSGATCTSSHSCSTCTTDSQCAAGDVCNNGTCIAACSASNACSNGGSCCGGHCFDEQNDPLHCGTCTTTCTTGTQACYQGGCVDLGTAAHCATVSDACDAGFDCCSGACTSITTLTNCGGCNAPCAPGDFCDGTSCHAPTYPNFCANPEVYVIYDGLSVDDPAADVMASTITQYCPSTVAVTEADQTDPTLVDQTTGEPLKGSGVTYIMVGGPYASHPVKWLEKTDESTLVYFDQDSTNFYFRYRADAGIAATFPEDDCSPHEDAFVVELVTDPNNGTLNLLGYGLCVGGYGTEASGYYYANVMLADAGAFPDSWYVVQWQAPADAGSTPGAEDHFSILAHGH